MSDVSGTDAGCVIIKVRGDFSFALNAIFKDVLQRYSRGEQCFALDMSEVHQLDSSALGMLLQLRDHSRDGEKVRLLNPQEPVKQLLQEAAFPNLFTLVGS